MPLWAYLAQEFLRVVNGYGWTFAEVDAMTLRQVIYAWAMLNTFQRERLIMQATAARAAQVEKDKDFEKWIKSLE